MSDWSRKVPRYWGWKFWRWGRPTLFVTTTPHGLKTGDVVAVSIREGAEK